MQTEQLELAKRLQDLLGEVGQGDFFDNLLDYCVGDRAGATVGTDVVNEFIEMVDRMVEDLEAASIQSDTEADDDFATLLYRLIEQQADLPELPKGWSYMTFHGTGAVGITHNQTRIEIAATPGYEDPNNQEELFVEVIFPQHDSEISFRERWCLPRVDVACWHRLLCDLASRYSVGGITAPVKLETWESPLRGNTIRAVTPLGRFIVDKLDDDDSLTYQNFVVDRQEFWVYFHPEDQFCRLVDEPKPWATGS